MGDTNTNANITELNRRGYLIRINQDLNENEWIKDGVLVSIHTVRSSPPGYFKSLLNQKEAFKFEEI